MDIAVIGTGKLGHAVGAALAAAGHDVRYGSRSHPVGPALDGAAAVVVCIPGEAVEGFARDHAGALDGTVVIDAANRFDGGPAHSAAQFAAWAPGAHYARAFNALGWENVADPVIDGVTADLLYSADEDDREIVERVVRDTGLRPVYLGPGQHDLLDHLFTLWFALVTTHGRRHLALKVL